MAGMSCAFSLAAPEPANAAPEPANAASSVIVVSGSLSGAGTLIDGPCLEVIEDGTVTLAAGETGTFHMDFCLQFPSPGPDFPIESGTFAVTTSDGTLAGTVGGSAQGTNQTPDGFPAHVVLSIASGTGLFDRATGSIVVDGFLGIGASTINGATTGSITLFSPVTPKNKDDCKNDGYRRFTDEAGVAFKNQGACVAWVVHHG